MTLMLNGTRQHKVITHTFKSTYKGHASNTFGTTCTEDINRTFSVSALSLFVYNRVDLQKEFELNIKDAMKLYEVAVSTMCYRHIFVCI